MILTSCSWSSPVWGVVTIIKVIKIIEHQVHVLLFFTLKVVDNALVFVDFDPDMSISLARDSSRLYKVGLRLFFLHVVIALASIRCLLLSLMLTWLHRICRTSIELLLTSAHGLIVEFSTLFLKLIVTDVESVSSKAMIAHSHLVSTSTKLAGSIRALLSIEGIIVSASRSGRSVVLASTPEYLPWNVSLFSLVVRTITIPITVGSVVSIYVVRVLMMSLNRWSLTSSSYIL